MVYTEKCDNCGKLLDFGGDEEENELPNNAIEFDGSVYCRECVHELLEFGGVSVKSILHLKKEIDAIKKEFGLPEDLAQN